MRPTFALFARKIATVQGCLRAFGIDAHPFNSFIGIAVELSWLVDVEKGQHRLNFSVPLVDFFVVHKIDIKSTD